MPSAPSSSDRPAWGWIALTVIACAYIGIAPQAHAFEVVGVPDAVRTALRWQAGVALFWAAAAIPLATRWSLADREGRALLGLFLLAITVSVAAGWLGHAVLRTDGQYGRGVIVMEFVSGALPTHALTAAMLSLVGSWTSARRQRARARDREALLAAHATRAELEALRERMQPHFVLNALNTVAALARRGDGDAAAEAAADLGELLQFSLAAEGDLVAFDTERRVVERCLAIEQARLGDRLVVSWSLDPAVRTTHVPALSWQPLVENAIRHGIARRTSPGRLQLSARRDAAHVVLAVDADGADDAVAPPDDRPDDHPGIAHDLAAGGASLGGLGLGESTLDRRLALLYGERASLTRTPRPGGTRTELRLPLDAPGALPHERDAAP